MFMRMVYDEKLAQAAYLIGCQRTGEAIVIDPQRDVDRYISLALENELRIVAVTETHIHADFVSGTRELAEKNGAKVYLSDEGDADWKYQWLDKSLSGSPYSHQLLKDGDEFAIGNIQFKAVHTPGHTPEHISFLITDLGAGANEPIGMATGDFVFVGDLGRPDLLESAAGQSGSMKPSAIRLFKSISTLDSIPDFVQVWPAHGAGSACGKALGAVPMSTIGYEKRFNPAIKAGISEDQFIDYILSGQPEPPMYFATMKRVNKEGPKVLGELPIPHQMQASDLIHIDAHKNAIIDTRPWEAYRDAHIPNTLSIPLDNTFNTVAGAFIPENESIYLIIEPTRVDEAVRDLIRVGLDNVKGWINASDIEQAEEKGISLMGVAELTADEARSAMDSQELQVLDVRRATEFAEGHLPAAINIAHTRLASRLDELPHNKRLLIYCLSGVRSARSSSYLLRNGYQVVNLEGGILAWEESKSVAER
ncbi:MAG: MBL fold metallo-hydrolase [Phycisphaerales bacterium]|nr:MBL fold metallo-hydrolase [Phycisphaerales bacterium]